MDLSNFLDRLASKEPAPGGGAASALVGIVSNCLGLMVVHLTEAKKGYEASQDRLKELGVGLERIRARLDSLMAEDEAAFGKITEAWKMPRDSDEQKATRRGAIQESLKGAIVPPWKIATESSAVLDAAVELLKIGNKNAITDAGCALSFAYSACQGALMNVAINLDAIDDKKFVEDEKIKVDLFLEDLGKRRANGLETLNGALQVIQFR